VTTAHVWNILPSTDCTHLTCVLQTTPENLIVQSLLLLLMYRLLEAVAYVTFFFTNNNKNNNINNNAVYCVESDELK